VFNQLPFRTNAFQTKGKLMRKVSLVVSLLALGLVAMLGAGAAQAKLDPSFGQAGILSLAPPSASGWQRQQVYDAATGGDGQVFSTYGLFRCLTGTPCESRKLLVNYLANGTVNTSFGGPGGQELEPEAVPSALMVSADGLPVLGFRQAVTREAPGSIRVRRLLADGAPDPGFGTGGTTTIPCECGYGTFRLLPGPENATVVMLTEEEVDSKSGPAGAATLWKLNAAGLSATKYGAMGSVSVRIPGEGSLEYEALAPGGAAYFGGVGKSGGTYQGALTKVTASGKVDKNYARTATRSLHRLITSANREDLKVTSAVAAKNGEVTLFGVAEKTKGFELRLRPSGKLETRFGKNGVRRLNRRIAGAVAGSEGAAMTIAVGSSPRVLRLLANGRPDPKFGSAGEELPGLTGGAGLSPAGKGKVDVIDLGITECRGTCQVDPKVYRFLEH
jgi:hypothetical protein